MVTRTRAILAGACAAALLGIGGSVLVGHSRPVPPAVAPTPAPIISSQAVATPVPTPTDAGHDGLRIKVPELGIDLPIVGGDGYNAPLYKAAHYPGTMWPGQGGRSVFYAHARTGMFGPLFQGRTGDHIQIVRPNGTVRA